MPDTMQQWFLGFLIWDSIILRYKDHEVALCATNHFDAEVMARRYWREQLGNPASRDNCEHRAQNLKPHSPHLIFRKNLFPGTTRFDWDSNKCAGAFLFFTLWEHNSFREVLVRESLRSRSIDQAWVEAHALWKAEIRDHRPYSTVRLISVKPREEIVYPSTPYLAVRKPIRF